MGKATLRTRGTWPICPDSARSLFRFRSCRERWSPPLCSCSFAFSLALSFSSGLSSLSLAHSVCLLAVHLLCQLANIFCGFIVRAWPGRVLVGPFESLAVLCVMQVQWDVSNCRYPYLKCDFNFQTQF